MPDRAATPVVSQTGPDERHCGSMWDHARHQNQGGIESPRGAAVSLQAAETGKTRARCAQSVLGLPTSFHPARLPVGGTCPGIVGAALTLIRASDAESEQDGDPGRAGSKVTGALGTPATFGLWIGHVPRQPVVAPIRSLPRFPGTCRSEQRPVAAVRATAAVGEASLTLKPR